MGNRTQNINIKYNVITDDLNKAAKESERAQRATDNLRKSNKNLSDQAKNTGNEVSKSFFNINNAIKAVSLTLLANEIISLGKKVIQIRGEFEKFEAVLTNTLGSKSLAMIALSNIQKFAATTPFSVSQLTENFIKLANRGVQPTIEQMRAIGDLSATLGKDFGQVVEAILDINNPERWKEIGVKAETAGNKVKLSFRGVTQEVDRTVEGVTKAVVALGSMNGVAGSTEAISKTLSGQVSNLGDAWEQWFNTIGKGNSGILSDTIGLLSKAIQLANDFLKSNGQKLEELQSNVLAKEVDNFKEFAKGFESPQKALEAYGSEIEKNIKRINDESHAQAKIANQTLTYTERIFGEGIAKKKSIAAAQEKLKWLNTEGSIYRQDVIPALEEYIKSIQKQNTVDARQLGLIQLKEEEIDKLQNQIKASTNPADLGVGGTLIVALKKAQSELDVLLGKAKEGTNSVAEYLGDLSDLEMFQTNEILKEKKEQRKRDADDAIEQAKRQTEEIIAFENQRMDASRQEAERQKALRQEVNDFIINSSANILENLLIQRDEDMSSINSYYQQQLLLAGDNERAKKEIQLKREQQEVEFNKRQKKRDKENALIRIGIDTAVNVIKSILANGGVPAGIPFGLIAAGYGLAQAAVVSRFKDGVIDLKGPGTKTSDSIPAMLSRGESVMTGSETERAKGIFQAVRAKKLDDRILKDLKLTQGGVKYVGMTDDRIVSELKAIRDSQPNIIQQGSVVYEVRSKGDKYKKIVRSKSMGI
jgi:hypothetical protein